VADMFVSCYVDCMQVSSFLTSPFNLWCLHIYLHLGVAMCNGQRTRYPIVHTHGISSRVKYMVSYYT
jgi:hypothetical protein